MNAGWLKPVAKVLTARPGVLLLMWRLLQSAAYWLSLLSETRAVGCEPAGRVAKRLTAPNVIFMIWLLIMSAAYRLPLLSKARPWLSPVPVAKVLTEPVELTLSMVPSV